jgi:hypothetical protein
VCENILAEDYIVVKIDQQRMTNAKAVIDKIHKPGAGNVGFSVDRETEIPHFVGMLKKTRSKISDQEIDLIVAALVKADLRARRRD